MSHHAYSESLRISEQDVPFSAFIMAAMMKADRINYIRLKTAFPEIRDELQERYDAPGGYLAGEVQS